MKKIFEKKILISIALIFLSLSLLNVNAAPKTDPMPADETTAFTTFLEKLDALNLISNKILDFLILDEAEIAAYIFNFLYPIGIAFGLYGIIMAGYTYMTSEGRPDKVKDANERLTQAVVGILFIMLSLVTLRLIIKTLFGADI